jgi:serine/threonine protein kinase
VTASGILVGTLTYLPPEVAQRHKAGFAAEVFSLGATPYTAWEGIPPFGMDGDALAVLVTVFVSPRARPEQSGPGCREHSRCS